MSGNGELKQVPAIVVAWDAETQQVQLNFATEDFKTWDFVLAVLGMAVGKAEQSLKMSLAAAMQQQAAAADQERRIRQNLPRR